MANKTTEAMSTQEIKAPPATSTIRNTSSRSNTGFSPDLLGAGGEIGGEGSGGGGGTGCEVESLKSKFGRKKSLETIYTSGGPEKTKGVAF